MPPRPEFSKMDFAKDKSLLAHIDGKRRAKEAILDLLDMNPLSMRQIGEAFDISPTREVDPDTEAALLNMKRGKKGGREYTEIYVREVANKAYYALVGIVDKITTGSSDKCDAKPLLDRAVYRTDPTIGDHVTGDHTYVYYRLDQAEALEQAGRLGPRRQVNSFKELHEYVDNETAAAYMKVIFRHAAEKPSSRDGRRPRYIR